MEKSEACVSAVNETAPSIGCKVAVERLSFTACGAFDESVDKGNELV